MGKKQVEESELTLFLESYAFATGTSFTLVAAGERPDFICQCQPGQYRGVELVKIFEGPNPQDTWDAIVQTAARKDAKRGQLDWFLPSATVLVLQLMVTEPQDFERFHDGAGLASDLSGLGFCEIWAAHWATVEPYGTVELFGLHPAPWWGRHRRPNWWEKPYG